jgi:geranylgeranylglycerol-phosphate geranylgeranyltransferase
MVIFAVLLGAVMARGTGAFFTPYSWLAAFAAALSLGAGNQWNDITDRREDRINRPDRPLPAGKIEAAELFDFSLLLTASAWLCGVLISLESFFIVLACQFILLVYALFAKGIPALGNILVAALTAVAVLYGAFVMGGNLWTAWDVAWLAFVVNLTRELVKDYNDRVGDKKARKTTLGGMLTAKELQQTIIPLMLVLPLFISYNLYLPGAESLAPTVHIIAIILITPLAVNVIWLIKDDQAKCKLAESRLKLILICGLVVYFVAALLR